MSDVITGGCRAQPGGLHLGHYYGCFYGLPKGAKINFVISDVLGNSIANSCDVVAIARDAIASGRLVGVQVGLIRESAFRQVTGQLAQRFFLLASFRELAEVIPRNAKVKAGAFSGTVADLLFPIYQSAYLVALKTTLASYNDDNSRFVDITRRLARRSNTQFNTSFVDSVRLLSREPGRLNGWNGERMSKAGRNCLPLSASTNQVRRFAARLVGRASAGSGDFDLSGPSEVELLYERIVRLAESPRCSPPHGLARIDCLADHVDAFMGHLQALKPSDDEALSALCASETEILSLTRKSLVRMRFVEN